MPIMMIAVVLIMEVMVIVEVKISGCPLLK